MTKLNSKLFNACTKRHRGAQPEHSVQHDRGRGWEHKHGSSTSSLLPAPAFQAIPPKWNYGLRALTDRAWPAAPWTHSYGNTAAMTTPTMDTSGSCCPGGLGAPSAALPPPHRSHSSLARPGAISGVKNQPHGQGHREPLGLSLKKGFHRLHRHEGDAMQPAHVPARLRPAWFVCWPGCCAKTP